MNKIEIDIDRLVNFLKTASFMETNKTFQDTCKMLRFLINNEEVWNEITKKANI